MAEQIISVGPESVIVNLIDYKGRRFLHDLTPAKNPHGSGWIIKARSLDEYAPSGIWRYDFARPNKPPRKMPNYNGLATIGWRPLREAKAICTSLNACLESIER